MKNTAEIMRTAYAARLGIPAFNVAYLPMTEPVIRAVVDQGSFALVEVARVEWMKFAAGGPRAVIEEYRRWAVPSHVRIHLDHVPVIDEDGVRVDYRAIIEEALALGYESVMVDASRLSLEDNIRATAEIVLLAARAGVPCEAELGAVLGHEAGPLPPYEELFTTGRGFTRPEEAARFVRETGCDWLSVAIGNVHGAVSEATRDQEKVQARLALDHLSTLSACTRVPLVLHGGSGIRQEDMLASMRRGIAKINVGTEIRQVYEQALRAGAITTAAQDAVYRRTSTLIKDWFRLSGSAEALLA